VATSAGSAATTAEIDLAVARRIAPLAAQIDALESTLRIQDVIGGVGYIAGIFGLIAFLKSRRRAGAP
jgi:nickel transport protein